MPSHIGLCLPKIPHMEVLAPGANGRLIMLTLGYQKRSNNERCSPLSRLFLSPDDTPAFGA